MKGAITAMAFVAACVLGATPGLAEERCTRTNLQYAADSYVAAQRIGDTSGMTLAPSVTYVEHRKPADLATGILSKALKIDFDHSLLDPETCQSYTEVIVADPAHAYVLGTRLKLTGGAIGEIEIFVSDADDWLFNASNSLKYASAESWDTIPAEARSDRATLIAAANAYFDLFQDKTTQVPWGSPCARLEGGLYTGKGRPDDTCNIGVPSGVPIVDRRFIVDEDAGAVVGLVAFGKNRLPDAHSFRVEKGRIRYVHTITICKSFNCGFPLPAQLRPER